MKIKTKADLLEAIADGRHVRADDIASRVLRCQVWGAGAGFPGCLYDSGPDYYASKSGAVSGALFLLADQDGRAPRGARASLERHGRADSGAWRVEVWQCRIADVI